MAAEAPTLELRDNYRSSPQVVDAAMAVLPLPAPLQSLKPGGPNVQVRALFTLPPALPAHEPSITAGAAAARCQLLSTFAWQ